jgi:hypothetical protein
MDGAWPDPIAIVRDRNDLDEQMRRAILVDGPATLFNIDVPDLLNHIGPEWSLDGSTQDLKGMLPSEYRPALGTAAAAEAKRQ